MKQTAGICFYDAIVIEKADHFLMMDHVKEFNNALEKAIDKILKEGSK